MTANAEARALLDQLMGVERDALLPAGKRIDLCSAEIMELDLVGDSLWLQKCRSD